MRKIPLFLLIFSILPLNSPALAWSLFAQETSTWQTVVIDPGHGGEDSGGSIADISEKNIALNISEQLAQAITKRLGLRVVLTRQKDESIPLINRSAIANNNKADIFLSIHCGNGLGGKLQGISIYVLSSQHEGEHPSSELISWDLAQNKHSERSMSLAASIHNSAISQGITSRGVFSVPLAALNGADMPAVLVEIGYLSNPEEVERLKDSDYQALLINSILEGILHFKNYE